MRPTKHCYYLNIALVVAQRATCLRRNYGAVIVKDDQIISTGYNGAPRNAANCLDLGTCIRKLYNIPPGEKYELCRSVHAEMNAVIHAARSDMLGSTLYLTGIEKDTGKLTTFLDPCLMCKRVIVNAGIKQVVIPNRENDPIVLLPEQWIKEGSL